MYEQTDKPDKPAVIQNLKPSGEAAPAMDQRELALHNGGLAARIIRAWETNKRYKSQIEKRLLHCLQARKGVYSSEELALIRQSGGNSEVYVQATGIKCRAAGAWMRDVLLPEGDERPWGLTHTPLPDIPDQIDEAIRVQATRKAQAIIEGGQDLSEEEIVGMIQKLREQVQDMTKEQAREAAEKMELKIRDIMAEGGFEEALDEFIEDFCTFPAAVIKGPYLKSVPAMRWTDQGPVVVHRKIMAWRRVSVFDIYPAPQARDCQTGDLIERIQVPRADLQNLIGMPGYSEKEIMAVIEEDASNRLHSWVDAERRQAEFGEAYLAQPDHSVEGLHFWGAVKGSDLKRWGSVQNCEDNQYYEIDAIMIGTHVIRAAINDNPLRERPYWKAAYDPVPGGFWGNGVPELMEDDADLINGSARALEDNMAICSGPQAVVNVDRVPENCDFSGIYPLKVWQTRTSMLPGDNGQPIFFYQPTSNANELLSVMNTFERRADDATGIPRYTYGNENVSGAASTAHGMSLLMSATAKNLRKAIGHVDSHVIKKSVRATFNHLMLYDPDPNIKGDINVVTRGTAAMLIKEQSQQARREFLTITNNPTDLQITGMAGRANVLAEVAKSLDMPKEKVIMGNLSGLPPEIQQAQAEIAQAREELQKAQADLLAKQRQIMDREQSVNKDMLSAQTKVEQSRLAEAEQKVRAKEMLLDERELRVKAIEHDARTERAGASIERSKAETERRMSETERRMAQSHNAQTMARVRAMTEAANAQMREILGKARAIQQGLHAQNQSVTNASVKDESAEAAGDQLEQLLAKMVEVQQTFATSIEQLHAERQP